MKERKVPMRKCVGCMQSREKQELIRIAAYEGQISVDPTGRAKGRGVYICRNSAECREKADKRKALERAFSMAIPPETKNRIFEELKAADQAGGAETGHAKGQEQ